MQLLNDTIQQSQAPQFSSPTQPAEYTPTSHSQEPMGGRVPQEPTTSPYSSQSAGHISQPSQSPTSAFQATPQNMAGTYSSPEGQNFGREPQISSNYAQPPVQPSPQHVQSPYSQEPPPYDNYSSPGPQSPYGSQNQATNANSGPTSPYGSFGQPSAARAPYDSSVSTSAPYSMPQRAPYDMQAQNSPQPVPSQPQVTRPPPMDAWGDSLQQNHPSQISLSKGSADLPPYNDVPQQQQQQYQSTQQPQTNRSPYGSAQEQNSNDFANRMNATQAQQNPQSFSTNTSVHPNQPSNTQYMTNTDSLSNFGSMRASLPKPGEVNQPGQQNYQAQQRPNQGVQQQSAQEMKFHPFIVRLVQEHPRSVPNIQVALLVAEEAKKADRGTQYQDALDLYTEALERFILVFNRWFLVSWFSY